MKLIDWVALGLVALLAVRAVMRARKMNKQGCGGGCSGCAIAGQCADKRKADET